MKTIKLNATQRNVISQKKRITLEMRKSYFPSMDVNSLRECLEENGLNPKMTVETEMTDVAIICKGSKLYMKVCSERDARREELSIWSGPIIDGVEPSKSAIDFVFKQNGIWVAPKFLEMRGIREYRNTNSNGEENYVFAQCYVLRVDYVPDFSSADYRMMGKNSPLDCVVDGQREFVKILQKSLI